MRIFWAMTASLLGAGDKRKAGPAERAPLVLIIARRAKDATGRAGPVRAGRRWLGSRSPALAERRHDPDPGGAPLARPLGFNEGPDRRGLRLSQRYRTSIHSGISASPLS